MTEARRRRVSSRLAMTASGPTEFVLSLAVAAEHARSAETLDVRCDGRPLEVAELRTSDGARLHRFRADAGEVVVEYAATVDGRAARAVPDELDPVVYLRPSRYCESDSLTPTARRLFGSAPRADLPELVERWVHERLDYRPEASSPTGGAEATLAAGAGVCRDYAHLVITLLRALDVPARLTAVYAPGLRPRDFHAVAEALVDDRWVVLDATRLAPRSELVRISSGRDAADTAFVTNTLRDVVLHELDVHADVVVGGLGDDGDRAARVRLG